MITLRTENPDEYPLPDENLLKLQFHLNRVAALSGASEIPYEFDEESNDEGNDDVRIYDSDSEPFIPQLYPDTRKPMRYPRVCRLSPRLHGAKSIQCSTILTNARYAYVNTLDTESKLWAPHLALIIQSPSMFRRSRTVQVDGGGGSCFWFVCCDV